VHFEEDGLAHGVDVWESVEAYEQFVQSTLMPAMGKVAAARGLDPSKMGEPEVTITEIHRLVRSESTPRRTRGSRDMHMPAVRGHPDEVFMFAGCHST
jgi:hypothetical protein